MALGATAAAVAPQSVVAAQEAGPSVAEAQESDGPTAAEVRGYYREISTRLDAGLTHFQQRTRVLSQYRVLDLSGGDFELIQEGVDGRPVTVSREAGVLTIETGGERLTESPKGLVLETSSARFTRKTSGEFSARWNRRGYSEEIRREKSGRLFHSIDSRDGRFGYREAYEAPDLTLAVYPGPVLSYRFEPFQNGKPLGVREVTVYQDGSSKISLKQGDSPPEVQFESGWSQD